MCVCTYIYMRACVHTHTHLIEDLCFTDSAEVYQPSEKFKTPWNQNGNWYLFGLGVLSVWNRRNWCCISWCSLAPGKPWSTSAWILLLLPLLLLHQQSLHSDMNECLSRSFMSSLSLFLEVSWLFLCLHYHLKLKSYSCNVIAVILKANLNMKCPLRNVLTLSTSHVVSLDFEGKYTDIFVTYFLVWFL